MNSPKILTSVIVMFQMFIKPWESLMPRNSLLRPETTQTAHKVKTLWTGMLTMYLVYITPDVHGGATVDFLNQKIRV